MHPDSGKSGGFFNKVMHMVRGKAGAPASFGPSEPDSLSASELLQEAVVRKRRNEAIRQQEFAQLRLLRQRSDAAGDPAQSHRGKDDEFSSILGQEIHTTETLQKIDAIEAQMSGQWWRQPAQMGAQAMKALTPRQPNARQLSDLPVLGDEQVVFDGVAGAAPGVLSPALDSASLAFSASVKPAVRLFKPHPDQEEAAILFAHGDINGARTRLLELLVQALSSTPLDEEKIAVLWHSVLDVCRATGDEETFEPLAIDYAEHFGYSAPLWSSIPARLGMQPLCGAASDSAPKRRFQWSCPGMLTLGAVTALRLSQADAPQPWSMSWVRLVSVDEAALKPLGQLFSDWGSSDGQFVVSDAGKLLNLLAQQTPVGDRTCSTQWWVLRMAVLRWMHRMDAYEQVALDYCVTYEVSPPAWTEPVCHCVVQEEGEADISVFDGVSVQSTLAKNAALAAPAPDVSKGLAGVIEGDPQERLDFLSSQAQRGQVLEIACESLIRLDFVAAGSVLNWAAEMQNKGFSLRFTQLHQLLAVFFHTIGIHEHASVQVART